MYPYLVPDGRGSILSATSDGFQTSTGECSGAGRQKVSAALCRLKFPMQEPGFFAYQSHEEVVFHNAGHKVLWSSKLQVSNVGRYVTAEGEQLPFAKLGYGKESELKIFSREGKLHKTVKIPEWASEVDGVAWPAPVIFSSDTAAGLVFLIRTEMKYSDTLYRAHHLIPTTARTGLR